MAKTELTFTNIDASTLPADVQALYAELKAAWKLSKAAKDAFELAARQVIPAPAGHKTVFGHKFGKLGVAFAPDDQPKAKAGKPVLTLAQFQAQYDALGQAR